MKYLRLFENTTKQTSFNNSIDYDDRRQWPVISAISGVQNEITTLHAIFDTIDNDNDVFNLMYYNLRILNTSILMPYQNTVDMNYSCGLSFYDSIHNVQSAKTITGTAKSAAFELNTTDIDGLEMPVFLDLYNLTASTNIIIPYTPMPYINVDLCNEWKQSNKTMAGKNGKIFESYSNSDWYHKDDVNDEQSREDEDGDGCIDMDCDYDCDCGDEGSNTYHDDENATLKLRVHGYETITLYLASSGENNYDYVYVKCNNSIVLNKKTSTIYTESDINNFEKYERLTISIPDKSIETEILVVYRKDVSQYSNLDRGFLFIDTDEFNIKDIINTDYSGVDHNPVPSYTINLLYEWRISDYTFSNGGVLYESYSNCNYWHTYPDEDPVGNCYCDGYDDCGDCGDCGDCYDCDDCDDCGDCECDGDGCDCDGCDCDGDGYCDCDSDVHINVSAKMDINIVGLNNFKMYVGISAEMSCDYVNIYLNGEEYRCLSELSAIEGDPVDYEYNFELVEFKNINPTEDITITNTVTVEFYKDSSVSEYLDRAFVYIPEEYTLKAVKNRPIKNHSSELTFNLINRKDEEENGTGYDIYSSRKNSWKQVNININGIGFPYTYYETTNAHTWASNTFSIMKVNISGNFEKFVCYIRSCAESLYDYTVATYLNADINNIISNFDNVSYKESTQDEQYCNSYSIDDYKKVEYTYDELYEAGCFDGDGCYFYIIFKKDGSEDENHDLGAVIIPSYEYNYDESIWYLPRGTQDKYIRFGLNSDWTVDENYNPDSSIMSGPVVNTNSGNKSIKYLPIYIKGYTAVTFLIRSNSWYDSDYLALSSINTSLDEFIYSLQNNYTYSEYTYVTTRYSHNSDEHIEAYAKVTYYIEDGGWGPDDEIVIYAAYKSESFTDNPNPQAFILVANDEYYDGCGDWWLGGDGGSSDDDCCDECDYNCCDWDCYPDEDGDGCQDMDCDWDENCYCFEPDCDDYECPCENFEDFYCPSDYVMHPN